MSIFCMVIILSQKTPEIANETDIYFGKGCTFLFFYPARAGGLLAPNIQFFGSKLHIFVPSGQLEPHQSMFSTRKRCFIVSLIWGYQKFYSILPQKMNFLPKNGQILPKTDIFGPFDPIPTKKQSGQVA